MRGILGLIIGTVLLTGCATPKGGATGPASGAGAGNDPNWGNDLETRGSEARLHQHARVQPPDSLPNWPADN